MKTLFYLAILTLVIQTSFAQINRYSELEGLSISKENRLDIIHDVLNLQEDYSLKTMNSTKRKTIYKHNRYQQFYKGLEVVDRQIIVHSEKDVIKSAFGDLVFDIELDIVPIVSIDEAEDITKEDCVKKYIAVDPDEMNLEIDLSIYKGKSAKASLVYKVESFSNSQHIRHMFIIDAITGMIIEDYNMICEIGVPAQGLTTYYGMQEITVDSISPDLFELFDPERNIRTLTNINNVDQSIHSEDNSWILDEDNGGTSAIDVHYGSIQTNDFFLNHFNYLGMDNAGGSIISKVQLGGGVAFNNAFWNGQYMLYGSGDCNHFPTTSLEIVAHEYMHAVTEFTSGLNYNGEESAGLNEGLSDIFGKAIEYENQSESFDWVMGGKLAKNDNARAFRNLQDPWVYENPKYYEGQYYEQSAHIMGSIFGHWYYLLIEGGNYSNEVGETFDLNSISREDAIQIIFNAMTEYALPTSGYKDVVTFTQLSSIELFGENSTQYDAITEAWTAVGLAGVAVPNFDLTFSLNLPSLTCISKEALSFSLDLVNIGSSVIPAGTTLDFRIVSGEQEFHQYTLTSDLSYNQRVTIPLLNGPLIKPAFSSHFIEVYLLVEDDNMDNNFVSKLIKFVGPELFDISLNASQVNKNSCDNEILKFYIEIENESCNPIEKGTQFELKIFQDESEIHSETFETHRTLYNSQGMSFEVEFPSNQSMEFLTFEAIYPLEMNTENNSTSEEVKIKQVISEKQLFVFDNAEEYEDLLFISSDFVIFPFVYEGESMLAATGVNEGLGTLCPEVSELFDLRNIYFLKACVDFMDWIEPTLTFDLIQLRNSLFEDEPDHELHNVTKVEWNSPQGSGVEYIYNQAEGEKVAHSIDLPFQFAGEVKFSFFHMTGDPFSIMYEDFSEYDFTFLDNLKFKDNSVSTEEEEQQLSINPNPASSKLYIDTELSISKIEVYTIVGQQVLDMKGRQNEIDISGLPNGLYIIKLNTEGDNVVEKSFVKI